MIFFSPCFLLVSSLLSDHGMIASNCHLPYLSSIDLGLEIHIFFRTS